MILSLLLFTLVSAVIGFENVRPLQSRRMITIVRNANDNGNDKNKNNWGISSLFQEMNDMLSNWDDVIDDFMFKRMGNGELFYGKRKYKPSNKDNMDGQYRGMGISDSAKIELARQRKEEMLERRRQQLGNRD